MEPVQALSFDLDDTLLDGSRFSFQETILHTCAELAKVTGLDANRTLEANGKTWGSYWPVVEEKWTLGGLSGAEVGLEAWRRTLMACGRDDESLARLARDIHSKHRRKTLRLFDDVHEFLNVLKPRLRLAVITNGASDTSAEHYDCLASNKSSMQSSYRAKSASRNQTSLFSLWPCKS